MISTSFAPFIASWSETGTTSEAQARQQAMDLVRDLTDLVDIDDELVQRIIR